MDTQSEVQQPRKPPGRKALDDQIEEPLMRKRNNKYYLKEDPMVVFQVEDQLFKVHQYHLAQESEHFRQLFKLPATPGSDERPLPLPGVTVEEFEALLDYFYRPHAARTVQVYLDLLSISHRFQMPQVLQFSREKLKALEHHIQPLNKLVLGDKYGIEDWVSSAFNDLLIREETLSVEEAMALGFDRFVGFITIREEQLGSQVVHAEGQLKEFRTQPQRRRRRAY